MIPLWTPIHTSGNSFTVEPYHHKTKSLNLWTPNNLHSNQLSSKSSVLSRSDGSTNYSPLVWNEMFSFLWTNRKTLIFLLHQVLWASLGVGQMLRRKLMDGYTVKNYLSTPVSGFLTTTWLVAIRCRRIYISDYAIWYQSGILALSWVKKILISLWMASIYLVIKVV